MIFTNYDRNWIGWQLLEFQQAVSLGWLKQNLKWVVMEGRCYDPVSDWLHSRDVSTWHVLYIFWVATEKGLFPLTRVFSILTCKDANLVRCMKNLHCMAFKNNYKIWCEKLNFTLNLSGTFSLERGNKYHKSAIVH